jgi:hypothetical protein
MRKSSPRVSGSSRSPSSRAGGPQPRRSTADPGSAPFSGFLERDQARQQRQRSRRRTLVISLGVHAVVLVVVLLYSVFQVDELFGPSVGVKVMRHSQLPKGVLAPPPAVDPATIIPGEPRPTR